MRSSMKSPLWVRTRVSLRVVTVRIDEDCCLRAWILGVPVPDLAADKNMNDRFRGGRRKAPPPTSPDGPVSRQVRFNARMASLSRSRWTSGLTSTATPRIVPPLKVPGALSSSLTVLSGQGLPVSWRTFGVAQQAQRLSRRSPCGCLPVSSRRQGTCRPLRSPCRPGRS